VVDYLRSSSVVPTRLFSDSTDKVGILWTPARSDAPLLGIPTAFASRIWDGGHVPTDAVGGADLPGSWHPTYHHATQAGLIPRVGTDEVFRVGVPLSCSEDVEMCCTNLRREALDVPTIGQTQTELARLTLPAGLLSQNGQSLRIQAAAEITRFAPPGTDWLLEINGVPLQSRTSFELGYMLWDYTLVRLNATDILSIDWDVFSGTSTAVFGGMDWTTAQLLRLLGTSGVGPAADGDLRLKWWRVDAFE